MEIKEDAEAGHQVTHRHVAVVMSWRSPWQLWKHSLPAHNCLRQFNKPEEGTIFSVQQKCSNIPCFWENQPIGCLRISCIFHHSKSRNINGLFLPPDSPLHCDDQEGIQHPTHSCKSPGTDKYISLAIHPPVIINLDDEDDEEDSEEEENYISEWVPKTAADIEEERAIKEICYKSGEFYRVQYPQENQSTSTVPSFWENGLLPFEAPKQVVQKGIHTSDYKIKPSHQQMSQRKGDENAASISNVRGIGRKTNFNYPEYKGAAYIVHRSDILETKSKESTGDGTTTPTKSNNTEREGKSSDMREPREGAPVTGCVFVENAILGIHTSDRKVKPSHQQMGQRQGDKTAAFIHNMRETGRKTHFSSPEYQKSAYVVYRSDTQEPKSNGSTDKYNSGFYSAPAWKNRNPHAKTFPKNRRTIHVLLDKSDNRAPKCSSPTR
ncbi:uncharacterized protein C12orf50 homolog [Colius striatus]|uniref:uncharacterized protein C12orf50 homolog n=1 Tax=Colius striatus TaxID=57412 RepID=UPI002B1D5D8C|nr:uncharacterized protein C12orf50 homolog [Colius striatus]